MSIRDEVGHGPRESATARVGRWLVAVIATAVVIGGCKSDDKPSPADVVGASEAPAATDEPADASATDDAAAREREPRVETRPPPPAERGEDEVKTDEPKTDEPKADDTARAAGGGESPGRPAPPTVAPRPRDGLVPVGPRSRDAVAGGVHPARLAGGEPPSRPEPVAREGEPAAKPDEAGGDEARAGEDSSEGEATAEGRRESAPAVLAPRGPDAPARKPGAGVAVTPPRATPALRPLDVAGFLPLDKVREIVGERRVMPAGPIAGIEASPAYNSLTFSVPGKEGLGVAVQVWKDGNRRDVNERFLRMRAQYPNAADVQTLAPTKAFYSWFGAVQTLTFFDTAKLVVVSVSCGEAVCSQKALLDLVKQAQAAM